MAKNATLNAAKDAKHDEYYTRYDDIQQELNHYEAHFKGKTEASGMMVGAIPAL